MASLTKHGLAAVVALTTLAWSQESRPLKGMDRVRALRATKPEVGKIAPDFDLMRVDGKGHVKLSAYQNDRPVLLVFGSWT